MADKKPDPRFRAPNPTAAAKRRAAIGAFLNDGGGFGARVYDPNNMPASAMDRARAAYAQDPTSVAPGAANWLTQLAQTDPKDMPKGVRNWLINMVKSTVRDPMTALLPVPKASLAARAARPARLQKYVKARDMSERMKGVNSFLGEKRTAFDQGLQPPKTLGAPVKEYITEKRGKYGVDVVDEISHAPERITRAKAEAAGVFGAETYPLPPYRFTQKGPRVEIHD